jgi:hypothetical protein
MLQSGMSLNEFPSLEFLDAEKGASAILGVNFNDTTQGAKMEMLWETEAGAKKQTVVIKATIGELIRPITMSESMFITEQGKTSLSPFYKRESFVFTVV